MDLVTAVCIGCHKRPNELSEYVDASIDEDITPESYVRLEEGTYNPSNGHFLCTPCYVQWGAPTGEHGWVAP